MNIAARIGMWTKKGEDMKTITVDEDVRGATSAVIPEMMKKYGIDRSVAIINADGFMGVDWQLAFSGFNSQSGAAVAGARYTSSGGVSAISNSNTIVIFKGQRLFIIDL